MQRALILVATLSAGCGPTKGNFGQQLANVACDRYQECNKADFEAAYSDMGDCQDTVASDYQDFYDCLAEKCDFDGGKAGDCIGEVKDVSCEDLNAGKNTDSCDTTEIYDCSDNDLQECAAKVDTSQKK